MCRVGVHRDQVFARCRKRNILALQISLDNFEGGSVDIQPQQLTNVVLRRNLLLAPHHHRRPLLL